MDRGRFEHLLEAYGADFRRWPEQEREAGARLAARHPDLHALAQALDASLDLVGDETPFSDLLARRILMKAPKARQSGPDRRALWALAACAVFGIVAGYAAGLSAPLADGGAEYLAMSLEPAPNLDDMGEGG